MRILRLAGDRFWIDTEPEPATAIREHLLMYRVGREVEVSELDSERAILSLVGPESPRIAGAPPLEREHRHAARSKSAASDRAPSPPISAST